MQFDFYRKISLENLIMLLSLIEVIILLIHMFLIIRIIMYIFTFLQTVILCMINIKFTKISKGIVQIKFEMINIIILIINTIYLIGLFILYLVELSASIVLTIYSCKFLNIIKNKLYNNKEKTPSFSESIDIEAQTRTSSKLEHIKNSIYLFRYDYQDNSQLFYSFKKKQLTFLYLSNIICTIFECSLDVALVICIGSSLDIIQLITYFNFLVTLFHNIIIFFAFFWIVRNNFNLNMQILNNTETINEGGLIDDNFIENEVKKIETQRIISKPDENDDNKLNKKTTYVTDDFE